MNQSLRESQEIQQLFNKIAPKYDQLNQWLSLGQHNIWKLMAVKWSEPNKGDIALDLCCGSGDLSRLLAKKVGKEGIVYGVDFAREQLAIAEMKANNSLPLHRFNWVEADALSLPFADNYFDCATLSYGLRNVVNIPLCLQELYRVLKKEAKVAILDFHRPYDAFWQTFQEFYLDYLVVPTADYFGLKSEYAYIKDSVAKFPQGQEQIAMAKKANFTEAVHYPLVNGVMGVLVATK